MKLIKPYFEIINQQPSEIGMLKHIEAQGRVAWKSEDKITSDSYLKFIEMLKGVNHGSVLEHGTVYLQINAPHKETYYKYYHNRYSKTNSIGEVETTINNPNLEWFGFITTNYRVLVENNWLDDLKYQCEPTEFHEKRVTVKIVCDRGVSHEFVRHRTFSFTQESTRYCNYSKDKFGNELTFIEPPYFNKLRNNVRSGPEISNSDMFTKIDYLEVLSGIELSYNAAIIAGLKPQEARAILPSSLKTELIMTGFISDWKHFFMLRCAPGAHPQAQEIAIPLEQEFQKLEYL